MIYAAALSLLEYYSSRQNRVAEMKCYYILAICLHDLDVFHFHKEILQYCEMVIVRYEELYDTLSDMEKSYGLSIYDLLSVCRYEMLHADFVISQRGYPAGAGACHCDGGTVYA